MSEDTMHIWNQVCTTDPKDIKQATRGLSSIKAYKQFEMATRLWGSFGDTWKVINPKREYMPFRDRKGNESTMCLYTAQLLYPKGEIEIHADIKVDDQDWSKKVATAALTKGLSMLGFNADVFMSQFEDEIYRDEQYLISNEKEQKRIADVTKKKNAIAEAQTTLKGMVSKIKDTAQKGKATAMIKKAFDNSVFSYENFDQDKVDGMKETIQEILDGEKEKADKTEKSEKIEKVRNLIKEKEGK
jgi:hypothetical protein